MSRYPSFSVMVKHAWSLTSSPHTLSVRDVMYGGKRALSGFCFTLGEMI
jgi:hypothetical protein